jgi:membrane fusion protein (multidrug efflux system)
LQGNFRVYVVDENGVVKMTAVEPGPQVGRLTLINSGLKAGEQVAIEGLLSLADGATIKPKLVEFADQAAPGDTSED